MFKKITDSYKVGAGDWDAMHSFESRKVNGKSVVIGGVHTKMNAALKDFYKTFKLNPYVSSIKITMDKNAYTVNWEMTIEESPDGVAYVGITSRGGAGPASGDKGSIRRAFNQIVTKKKELPSEVNKDTKTVDVLDFYYKFSDSGAVRQIFVLYTNPKEFPNLPKSGSLKSGTIGFKVTETVGAENNAKVVNTSTVGVTPVSGTVSVSNAGQSETNPQATKTVVNIDGSAISTGGTFDFQPLKDSSKSEIGFISFPPRRSGSIPLLLIYPKNESLTDIEVFKLGKEEIRGKYSGVKMANRFISWIDSTGKSSSDNYVPDVLKTIGKSQTSPVENWFSKWCIVFARDWNTDFKTILNTVNTELDFRAMTISSLNLTLYAESGYVNNTVIEALSGQSFPHKIKTLMLLEAYPSQKLVEISKKVKSSGGQVYNVYNSQNFKTNITKTKIAGLSYSGPPFDDSPSSVNLTNTFTSQLSDSILFLDTNPGLTTSMTVSVTGYNSIFGVSNSNVYNPFPLIPYGKLPLTAVPGSSPSQFQQTTPVSFTNNLSFTYTTMPGDILKENGYVYDLSKDPVDNFKTNGASLGWPEVKLVNSVYVVSSPSISSGPIIGSGSVVGSSSIIGSGSSGGSNSITEVNIKYVTSHLQGPNIDFIPQLGFQIFYSDIEKNIGQSEIGASGSQPKTLLSGQFTFDVRKKGFLINDGLGEFKIIDKVELDLFVKSEEAEDMSLLSPEYQEGEFLGEIETYSGPLPDEFIGLDDELQKLEFDVFSLPDAKLSIGTETDYDEDKGGDESGGNESGGVAGGIKDAIGSDKGGSGSSGYKAGTGDANTWKKTGHVVNGSKVPKELSGPANYNQKVSLNKTVTSEYLPVIKNLTGYTYGAKLLAIVQAQKEGFAPGTRAYKTNNPGNIGNTDSGSNKNLKTLADGIKLQLNYMTDVANGKHKMYPVGKDTFIEPYYSPEIAKNNGPKGPYKGMTAYLPGYKFKYTGKLEQYVKIYATGARQSNSYITMIVSWFRNNGYTWVTEETTLSEIIKSNQKPSSGII